MANSHRLVTLSQASRARHSPERRRVWLAQGYPSLPELILAIQRKSSAYVFMYSICMLRCLKKQPRLLIGEERMLAN